LPSCGDSSEHEGPDSSKMIQSSFYFDNLINWISFCSFFARPERGKSTGTSTTDQAVANESEWFEFQRDVWKLL
jgi:hypothetical protein